MSDTAVLDAANMALIEGIRASQDRDATSNENNDQTNRASARPPLRAMMNLDYPRIRSMLLGQNPPPKKTNKRPISSTDIQSSDGSVEIPPNLQDSDMYSLQYHDIRSTLLGIQQAPPGNRAANQPGDQPREITEQEIVQFLEDCTGEFVLYSRDFPASSEGELESRVKLVAQILCNSRKAVLIQERLFLRFSL
jgi:hypothetical protein